MAREKGKAISVFSAKGGIGKTVFTINLAGIVSNLNKKVLIIDLDLAGGGIALALNKVPPKSIYNIVDDLNKKTYTSIKNYVTNYNDNIDFLASPKDPRNAFKVSARYIDIIIRDAKACYDVVLIDTNHMLSPTNLVMLDSVDNILYMVNNDTFTLKNTISIMSILKDLNFDNYKVILNNTLAASEYFSQNEIENIIKNKIDYTLNKDYYIKNIDDYIINGEIYTLSEKVLTTNVYGVLLRLVTDILKGGNDEKK